jgi:molecular chaperone GrpE
MRRLFGESEALGDESLEALTQIDAQPVALPPSIADADPVVAFQDMLISHNELDRQILEVRRQDEERRRDVLRSMLDVADSLDRMIRFARLQNDLKTPAAEKLIEALESTKRIMQRNLGKAGVKRLETLGTVPDTEFCEIHSERDAAGTQPGTVIEELLPGYTIDGKLLRAASVIVAAE